MSIVDQFMSESSLTMKKFHIYQKDRMIMISLFCDIFSKLNKGYLKIYSFNH